MFLSLLRRPTEGSILSNLESKVDSHSQNLQVTGDWCEAGDALCFPIILNSLQSSSSSFSREFSSDLAVAKSDSSLLHQSLSEDSLSSVISQSLLALSRCHLSCGFNTEGQAL